MRFFFSSFLHNRIGDVIASVLAWCVVDNGLKSRSSQTTWCVVDDGLKSQSSQTTWCVVDNGLKSRSSQTKDYEIDVC